MRTQDGLLHTAWGRYGDVYRKRDRQTGHHTLRDQGALYYSVWSLWRFKSRATVIQVPLSSSRWSIINYSHRCFLGQLEHSRSWLKYKAVHITSTAEFFFLYKCYQSSLVHSGSLHSRLVSLLHWQWLLFCLSLSSFLSFCPFLLSFWLSLPTVQYIPLFILEPIFFFSPHIAVDISGCLYLLKHSNQP